MRKILALAIAFTTFNASAALAHCEVPCGIYGDDARFTEIEEHTATIEKAMKKIVALGDADDTNYNQIVRWVTTKEDHANKIQDIVAQYFMTQRVKPLKDKTDMAAGHAYSDKLMYLHEMLVYAMKCKQTTDADNVAKLRAATSAFHDAYHASSHSASAPASQPSH